MNDGAQTSRLRDYNPGDPITAERLTETNRAIRSITGGTNPPTASGGREEFPVDIPPAYTKARLVVTSASKALSGLATIDGKTPADGDYILVATGATPGNDGLYLAAAGAWLRIVRLNYDQSGQSLVYPHGTRISIWDGTSGKGQIYMAAIDSLATF